MACFRALSRNCSPREETFEPSVSTDGSTSSMLLEPVVTVSVSSPNESSVSEGLEPADCLESSADVSSESSLNCWPCMQKETIE